MPSIGSNVPPAWPTGRDAGRGDVRRGPLVGHAWPVIRRDEATTKGRGDWAWASVVALAVVWAAGSFVNVAWRIGVEDGSLVWLLEIPASLVVAWWIGGTAWRRTRWSRP